MKPEKTDDEGVLFDMVIGPDTTADEINAELDRRIKEIKKRLEDESNT